MPPVGRESDVGQRTGDGFEIIPPARLFCREEFQQFETGFLRGHRFTGRRNAWKARQTTPHEGGSENWRQARRDQEIGLRLDTVGDLVRRPDRTHADNQVGSRRLHRLHHLQGVRRAPGHLDHTQTARREGFRKWGRVVDGLDGQDGDDARGIDQFFQRDSHLEASSFGKGRSTEQWCLIGQDQ